MPTDDTTPRLLQQLRDHIDARLDALESKVDKGFAGTEKRFDSIEGRMRLQQAGLESLSVDVQHTEKAVANLAGLLGNVADTVESNSQRIRALEQSLRDS